MLYTQDLDKLIFNRHYICDTDEFVVISGYLGPKPVKDLKALPCRSTVIYGMYGSEGISTTLHNSLIDIQDNSDNIKVFYSQLPVHSKCYIWRKKGEIVYALVGSANFSVNGLTTPFREVLAETTLDTFRPLNAYLDQVLRNSISCREVKTVKSLGKNNDGSSDLIIKDPIRESLSCRMSLLGRSGDVESTSGLNWGQNPKNHTNENDAYIAVKVPYIKDFPHLFPPKQINPQHSKKEGRPQRHNDSVEIIWDDGLVMRGLLEGSQPINDISYPKQISSFPSKSELGLYIRERIGIPSGVPVRKFHLDQYGRTHIDVSLLSEGVYKFDFSVPTQ